jgi:hypothetical protein
MPAITCMHQMSDHHAFITSCHRPEVKHGWVEVECPLSPTNSHSNLHMHCALNKTLFHPLIHLLLLLRPLLDSSAVPSSHHTPLEQHQQP